MQNIDLIKGCISSRLKERTESVIPDADRESTAATS